MSPLDHTHIATDNWVERYVLGRLSSADAEAFEDHYIGCEACAGEVEAAQVLARGFKERAADQMAEARSDGGSSPDGTSVLNRPERFEADLSSPSAASSNWRGWLSAAGLLAALGLSTFFFVRLVRVQEQLDDVTTLARTELVSIERLRTPTAVHRMTIPAQPTWLLLEVKMDRVGSRARIELADSTTVVASSEVVGDENGKASLLVLSTRLVPGQYRLVTTPCCGSQGVARTETLVMQRP